MLQKFNADDWTHYVPLSANPEDVRSCLIPLLYPSEGSDTSVSVELRSSNPMVLNAISADGETLFLSSGQVISFQAKLSGFTSVEVVTSYPFSHRISEQARWLEKADPTRHTVDIDESTTKPMNDLIKSEMAKMLTKMKMDNLFSTDESVQELMEDFAQGDLEFDKPGAPDQFGLGYEEMEPEAPDFDPEVLSPTSAKAPEPAPTPEQTASAPAAEPNATVAPT